MDCRSACTALLRRRNKHRRSLATSPPLLTGVLLLAASGVSAQTARQLPPEPLQEPQGVRITATQPSETPPDPLAAMAAYQIVDRWVRQWEITTVSELPVATAAAIILRLDGEIVGRGSDLAVRPEGDSNVTVLALQAAMREAESRMAIPRDALYQDALRDVARRITISVEFAGALVPFAPRDWVDATRAVEAGVEGVAVRLGDRTAIMFPATMLITRTEPAAAYAALLSRLSQDPALGLKPPQELSRDHGVVFYRFATTHIAQPRAGAVPEFLHRGSKVFEQRQLDAAELAAWADVLARNLLDRSSFGIYDPIRGETDEDSDVGRAIAALALVQYATLSLPPERSLTIRRGAARILSEIGDELPVAACAPLWVALQGLAVSGSPEGMKNLTATGDKLPKLLENSTSCLIAARPTERTLVALNTWGLAIRGVAEQKPGPEVSAAIRAIFRQTPAGELVSVMPWLGWAEISWSQMGENESVPAAAALRDMRDMLWQHQLRSSILPPQQRDFAGAIVFTKGGQVLPTWNAARPLAFIATMLGDERLTESAEVPAELARLLASLRFLRQLTAGEAEGHLFRNPDKALGGVRASPWDQRMPPEATALTLITVVETIRSLQAIEARLQPGVDPEAAPKPTSD